MKTLTVDGIRDICGHIYSVEVKNHEGLQSVDIRRAMIKEHLKLCGECDAD